MKSSTEALAALAVAAKRYNEAMAHLASIRQCAAHWPADPIEPGHMGTRCDLVAGHDRQPDGSQHRHRFPGTITCVTW